MATTRLAPWARAGALAVVLLGSAFYGVVLWLGARLDWTVELLAEAASETGIDDATTYDVRGELPWLTVLYVGVLVAAVLATRLPRHPVPWLLGAIGLGFLGFPAVAVTIAYAEALGVAAPWVAYVGWVGNWIWLPGHAGALYLLLLFPDGRPLNRRWALAGRAIAVYLVVALVLVATWPDLEVTPLVDNPFGVALPGVDAFLGPFLAGMILLNGVVAVGMILRIVRSSGVERLQLKWMAWGAFTLLLMVPADIVDAPRWLQAVPTGLLIGAIVVAITRYRLYDIDLVIRRTVAYTVISVVLAGVYSVATVTIGAILRAATSGGGDIAVAASTLAVAALFHPVRRRVRDGVDRRFNRRRYDAAESAAAFASRLRDEVDLATIESDLRRTVGATVQPATIGLWTR